MTPSILRDISFLNGFAGGLGHTSLGTPVICTYSEEEACICNEAHACASADEIADVNARQMHYEL